jgi:hypothetical protein
MKETTQRGSLPDIVIKSRMTLTRYVASMDKRNECKILIGKSQETTKHRLRVGGNIK